MDLALSDEALVTVSVGAVSAKAGAEKVIFNTGIDKRMAMLALKLRFLLAMISC